MHRKLIILEKQFNPSVLTKISDPLLHRHRIELWIKRDDLLHSVISGNKWRKLKYILDHVLLLEKHTIISMGGPYSNHLHALAYTGKLLNLDTVAYIRGERPGSLNPTLMDLQNWGMKLNFISRTEFKALRKGTQGEGVPGFSDREYWLPEGGSSILALRGVGQLVNEITTTYDTLCVPCGTGTTLAGVIKAAPADVKVLGIAALKGADFLHSDVKLLLSQQPIKCSWQINQDYHFGGFARSTTKLMRFIEKFEQQTAIELEPIYTGKMMFAIYDLIKQGYFAPGQRIIAVHTGGLQGKRGFSVD